MAYSYPFKTADAKLVKSVWEKGRIVPDKNGQHWSPAEWRYDICVKPIKFSEHGNTDSDVGWEIDHIKPKSKNGGDELNNLQPLQWENNRTKGDQYPWNC